MTYFETSGRDNTDAVMAVVKRRADELGIGRGLPDMDGYQAVRLWWRYVNDLDLDALKTLLEYNREDVVNLKTLRERLPTPAKSR